jgi:L-lactate dehydrogenase complex protein LldG
MSGRETIMAKVRAAQAAGGNDAARRALVAERLANAPRGVIPARGQLDGAARAELFCKMAGKLLATVERVSSSADVPGAVAAYLRNNNLPAALRMGADPRLASMPWDGQKAIEIKHGRSDGNDLVGVSHAGSGIAETGTILMTSGPDNPSTVNFLPDHHIVVVKAGDIEPDFESALDKVRKANGKGKMPRTVNFISGPSRSGDIEQKLILGAHGPRALHLIVVEGDGGV